jgi:RHS repeat-associated protein
VVPSYDALLRMTGISFGGASVATMAYDQTINSQEGDILSYANGASSSWQRNADQEPSRVIHKAKATAAASVSAIEDAAITWSNDGLMKARGADSFEYDALGRLSKSIVNGVNGQKTQQVYGYDLYGNRTSVTSTALAGALPEEAASFSLTVGTNNRLPAKTAAGALTGRIYDGLGRLTEVFAIPGNTTSKTTWNYDASGRVTSQWDAKSQSSESFVLEGSGLRFKRTKSNGTVAYTVYGFDREPLSIFEKPSGGSLTWKSDCVYGFGQLVMEVRGSTKVYQQGDHLGTPGILTNASGVVMGRQKALPFGERMSGTGEKSLRRFTNHEDGSGYPIYMQARTYLPTYGRFAQVDPAYDHSEDGLNLYSYCSNNPVTRTDPDGMREVGEGGGGDKWTHVPLVLDAQYGQEGWIWFCEDLMSVSGGSTNPFSAAIMGGSAGTVEVVAAEAVLQTGEQTKNALCLAESQTNFSTTVDFNAQAAAALSGGFSAQDSLRGSQAAGQAGPGASTGTSGSTAQALGYTTISGGPNSITWEAQWNLAKASKNGGWIIQKITEFKPDGSLHLWPYWEAWYIPRGSQYTVGHSPHAVDDTFSGGWKGHSITASAVFYEGLRSLPMVFSVPNPATHAGTLPASIIDPSLWLPTKNMTPPVTRTWVVP